MTTRNQSPASVHKEIYNFSAGPCVLPKPVLEKASKEMLDFQGTGLSVLELSHRGNDFRQVYSQAQEEIRKFLRIPENFRIMLHQGGATMQYAACAKNLIGLKPERVANILVTGLWSSQSLKEIKKFANVNVVANSVSENDCTAIPDPQTWNVDPTGSFFYFCSNETVNGLEFDFDTFPWHLIPEGMPVVADMSSNIGTKPVPWDKISVAFMGAQKNLGSSGCAVIVVREDLLGSADPDTPALCDWTLNENAPDHYYNTPSVFPIYVTGLNVKYMNDMGGLDYYNHISQQKSDLLWATIDGSDGFYSSKIAIDSHRSRVNVVFRVLDGNTELEEAFISQAAAEGIIQIKGHGFNPGVRISMYNAMPLEGVQHLCDFMRSFQDHYEASQQI